MSEQMAIALTFLAFLLLFTIIGIYSATQKQDTTADYLLASRNVNPWLTALSAMSTGQSAFLFTGQVGYAYTRGLSSIWLAIGWAIGDYLAWWLVFKQLRQESEAISAETVSGFLGQPQRSRTIILISALITIAFLGTYAAAQLVAGSKALYTLFGWDYYIGIIAGAIVVVIYCFSGGIRASIWTDAVQAVIMIGSLLILLSVALSNIGGWEQLWTKLKEIDSGLVSLSPASLPWGFLPFFVGWLIAGFGAVGQPHILVRGMAIDSADNLTFARNLKTAAGLITAFTATGIGLSARILLPELASSGDPELGLLYLSSDLLPAVLVGLMLAGLFAATMSTADSQILSCSAALTQDVVPGAAKSYKLAKLGTLTVTAIVLLIALSDNNSVFALITFSWSALASGLGPLLVLRSWRQPINTPVAVTMMGVGIATALVWNLVFGLSGAVYEVLPGMAAGSLVYAIARLL